MSNGTSTAVTEATRLSEIGFPEFTTKLVTDVFDALIAANIRQTQAYVELLREVSKSLKDFINDTKDDIGPEELLTFLAAVLPPENTESGDATKVKVGSTLAADDVTKLNAALATPESAEITDNNQVATAGALDQAKVDAILDAVAKRLAANKYDLLKEMVKLGMLRLVVDNGLIETRLIFRTYGSTFYQKHDTTYHRDTFSFRAKAGTGSLVSLWAKASASTAYTSVNVSTSDKVDQDRSGSSVQIFGLVRINFRTDYLPLATP